jgi:predicted HTH domain antitoxin
VAAITLEIPEDIVAALRFLPSRASEELRREFAVFLVKEGLLPRHQARQLAGLERVAFEDLLARRGVAWEGTANEVFADLDAAERAVVRAVSPEA